MLLYSINNKEADMDRIDIQNAMIEAEERGDQEAAEYFQSLLDAMDGL